jgi:hypothetical protein
VTINDANCTTPTCFSHTSDESYFLRITTKGVEINAPSLFGVNWAFSSIAALTANACRVNCLPLSGTTRADAVVAWCFEWDVWRLKGVCEEG